MRMASFARLAHLTQKLGMLVPVVWLGFLVAMVVASWPQPALAQLSCPVTQITPTSGLNFGVSMNAAGTHITFTSTLDLTGGNSDLNQEVFMFNTTTSTFTQITTTTGGHEPGGGISGDSTKIVVLSNADFTGGNPDSSQELFLFDLATSTFTQITNITVGSIGGVAINANGTRIAVLSSADLTGDNPDLNREIYLLDTTTNTVTQITNTTGLVINGPPSINADGTRIAFHAFADLTGDNPDGNTEIFLFNTTTNTFSQITNTTGSVSQHASISANGSHIAFDSTADLTGGNPDGSQEIFLFDTTTSTFTQITSDMGTVTEFPAVNANGTRIAFTTNGGGLFLFDITTNTFTNIDGGKPGEVPSISTDGTRIAFALSGNIFLAICDGEEPGDTWVTRTSMPTARRAAGTVQASNGEIYAIGGTRGPSPPLKTNEAYDSATDTWTTKAPMPTARDSLGVAAASNGKLYAIGGDNDRTGLRTNQEYDPATDTWTTKAPMSVARTVLAVAAASNGKLYAIGGTLRSNSPPLRANEEYDPATNTWTRKTDMPTARSHLGVATASNGKLYAIGGYDLRSNLSTVEEYDPVTDTWTTMTDMPTARRNVGVAAASNGKLYAIGGWTNKALATVEEYTPPE